MILGNPGLYIRSELCRLLDQIFYVSSRDDAL